MKSITTLHPASAAQFLLQSAEGLLHATGRLRALPAGSAGSLARRVGDFFASRPDGPSLLVGALPFDPAQPDCLYQPAQVSRTQASGVLSAIRQPLPAPALQKWRVTPHPAAAAYVAATQRAVDVLRAERELPQGLRKLVLSRSLVIEGAVLDPAWLVQRLAADPSVVTYRVPLPGSDTRTLVGATPELLVSRRGLRLLSQPLAGSRRRHADPVCDREAAHALQQSAKDGAEHRVVVEAILDALAPLCRQLRAPAGPALHSTATMWHLGTRIEGELRNPDTSAAELAARVHPTPAVCGHPPQRARALIAELEPYDRGFYAGAVGWTDGNGDGDWHVAIRCADIEGQRLRLYAGAGIVAESDPQHELEETSAKFAALLDALGIDEAGVPARDASMQCTERPRVAP